MKTRLAVTSLAAVAILSVTTFAISVPTRAQKGMVASQNEMASKIGADVIAAGGTAVDAVVATAFALAVVHPTAGNIGGGGFIVYRPAKGEPVTYDFRETAPGKASPTMFMKDGKYSAELHHNSYLAVGVPGTVAGLHMAWKEQGKLPWKRLVDPAIALARDGFVVSEGLSRSLKSALRPGENGRGGSMAKYPASVAQFSKNGVPYESGETLKQPDLARTLDRIATQGPAGFYEGETALALEKEMLAHGGLITRDDLKKYAAKRRAPVTGTYRGYHVISIPPASTGGNRVL
jgi:gamma-glutamyltranspeptidase/glutathione hydrolase